MMKKKKSAILFLLRSDSKGEGDSTVSGPQLRRLDHPFDLVLDRGADSSPWSEHLRDLAVWYGDTSLIN